ncbi:BMP family ABC transporter substrate-binding protein (plasmid) [Deinococcus sp. KNUC1210]|uniref:BMP family lipoprotein n=1 Tax=Deinococcus sp. KNUC1210 TaxID=2917691 RepID=UPI001EF002C8|nr:BMP family ABC transporter substrate-binding protein [Deinococcus sp. KNUC1210]ULH17006.1 BMP family ABC transporter substrate-binding protein [Deinococcus sp. KNUC1210]
MKASSAFLGLIVLAVSVALAQGTPSAVLPNSHSNTSSPIGLALDLGGKNDGGLNQSAWDGVQRAERELGVHVQVFSPVAVSGRVVRGAEPLAKSGAALVIAVGDANTDTLQKAAARYPATKFALVDDLPTGANTAGLIFSETEGAFLMGYIAAASSSTGVLGFVGGQDVPSLREQEAGYAAGVHFLCPKCKVMASYIGSTSAAWNNPAAAQRLSAALQAHGADVIFAAAGKSTAGVVKQVNTSQCLNASALPAGVHFLADPFARVPRSAAYRKACGGEARPTFFMATDTNHNALGDDDGNAATLNHGLTSSLYRVDNAVYSVIRDFVKGKPWQPGQLGFGLKNNGITYALDKYNRALISPKLERRLKQVQQLVGNGLVKLPAKQ